MSPNITKAARADLFRARLTEAIDRAGANRSLLARTAGVDRSTIAQLLADDGPRMPNAHLAAACAQALGVSADWLLGLTDRPERPGDVIEQAISMTDAARTIADDQLMDWHREAAGYKIRHVPATLPDVLKTEDVLQWEYARYLGKTAEQAVGAMNDRRAWLRDQLSDYEMAVSLGEFRAFAAGAGYYEGLAPELRRAQLLALADAARQAYPSMRIYLYDARRAFSAPITVFGPLLGVIYVGRFYLAFRSKERVRMLTRHFDQLVREAEVEARDFAEWVEELADGV